MNAITIRLATTDDIDILTHHRKAMFAEMDWGSEQSRARMVERFRLWVRPRLESGQFWTWLACAGQSVVAGAGVWQMDWPPGPTDDSVPLAFIYNVYTEPAYRRRGISRRLMEHTIVDCQRRGIRTLGLHASTFGRPLYEQLGFVPTNEMRLVLE